MHTGNQSCNGYRHRAGTGDGALPQLMRHGRPVCWVHSSQLGRRQWQAGRGRNWLNIQLGIPTWTTQERIIAKDGSLVCVPFNIMLYCTNVNAFCLHTQIY